MANYIATPQLGFVEALKEAKGKLTQFTGRSRRSEFWWCYLALFITNMVLQYIPIIGSIVVVLLGLAFIPLTFRRLHDTGKSGWWWGIGAILAVVLIGLIVAAAGSAAATGADFEDPAEAMKLITTIFSNPLVLIGYLALLVYAIIMLVFLCQDSKPEPNKYGESPKYVIE